MTKRACHLCDTEHGEYSSSIMRLGTSWGAYDGQWLCRTCLGIGNYNEIVKRLDARHKYTPPPVVTPFINPAPPPVPVTLVPSAGSVALSDAWERLNRFRKALEPVPPPEPPKPLTRSEALAQELEE